MKATLILPDLSNKKELLIVKKKIIAYLKFQFNCAFHILSGKRILRKEKRENLRTKVPSIFIYNKERKKFLPRLF